MAKLQLTDDEIKEVRALVGITISDQELPDETITMEVFLGAASDYVYETILNRIDTSSQAYAQLDQDERDLITRTRDEAAEDIANFVNVVLKPPQRLQFRRAIMTRTAGVLSESFSHHVREDVIGISTSFDRKDFEKHRDFLFDQCEKEIHRIGTAFVNDIFPDFVMPPFSMFTITMDDWK